MPNLNARKGAAFELLVQRYLQEILPKFTITRPRQSGYNDLGDVHADPFVLQIKDVAKLALSSWVADAEVQRANAGAEFGVVVSKKRGAPVGDAYVVMSLATFRDVLERIRR